MTNQPTAIITQTLLWEGRTIEVSYDPCWLGNESTSHMTITCINPPKGRLPLTETGYLSTFFDVEPGDRLSAGDVAGFVLEWFGEAATEKAWRIYAEANRQLPLF